MDGAHGEQARREPRSLECAMAEAVGTIFGRMVRTAVVGRRSSGSFDYASRDTTAGGSAQDDRINRVNSKDRILVRWVVGGRVGGDFEAEAGEFALLQAVVDEEADADGERNEAAGGDGENLADLKDRGEQDAKDGLRRGRRRQEQRRMRRALARLRRGSRVLISPPRPVVDFKSRSICSADMPRCTMAIRCSAFSLRAWA